MTAIEIILSICVIYLYFKQRKIITTVVEMNEIYSLLFVMLSETGEEKEKAMQELRDKTKHE